ncbi:diguanylate cyclase [Burkholderia sp. 22PA0106]|uniref:sensor domain-containing diguanylate cyclase n=1 Tax=Burkholderia sp. 22PA0106 TaxID=3237371 RepID=UPI0039C2618A
MPISETDEIAVAPADGPPVNPECAALLRLARAHFGADAALIVVSAAEGPCLFGIEGTLPAPLPSDPFATRASHAPDIELSASRAACALRAADGTRLGALLLISPAPHTPNTLAALDDFTALASAALERALREPACAPPGAEPVACAPFAHDLVALALNGSGTGIWDRDIATGEIRYSSEWKAILGYAPHELSTRIEDAVDRLHPDDRAYVQAQMRRHFEGGSDRYEVEHRIRCKDGRYKWICSRGKVVGRDGAGRALRMVGATTDITALRETAARLQQSIDLITNLTDEVDGLVFQYREPADGRPQFSYVSRGIEQIYELDPAQAAIDAESVDARIDPRDLAMYRQSLRESAATLTPWRLEYRVLLPRQGLRWRHGEARPQRLPDGGTLWHGFVSDTTERKRIEAELHELATIDHLTELANRRDFLAQSASELERLRRAGHGEAAVLMLDLDHFKSLNDRWGHALGDHALRHFARLMRDAARSADIVGRIGGEEFAIVLPGLGIEAAMAFGLRLQRHIGASPLEFAGQCVGLTVSIGVDRMTAADLGVDQVLSRCDKALYRAKARGRNRIELHGEPE